MKKKSAMRYRYLNCLGFVTATITTLSFGSSAGIAAIIGFEELPDGTTPTDDAALTDSYEENGTLITFGFDTNNDLVIDRDAVFESRNDSGAELAYTHSNIPDLDRTTNGEGGNWLLRAPGNLSIFTNSSTFLVQYSGATVNSASGQLWDIDYTERYLIEALSSSGVLLDSFLTPTVLDNEGPNTFSGLPFDFSFDALSDNIGFIRVTGQKQSTFGGGFAWDNFNATQSDLPSPSEPMPVPEPLSAFGTILGAGIGALILKNRTLRTHQP